MVSGVTQIPPRRGGGYRTGRCGSPPCPGRPGSRGRGSRRGRLRPRYSAAEVSPVPGPGVDPGRRAGRENPPARAGGCRTGRRGSRRWRADPGSRTPRPAGGRRRPGLLVHRIRRVAGPGPYSSAGRDTPRWTARPGTGPPGPGRRGRAGRWGTRRSPPGRNALGCPCPRRSRAEVGVGALARGRTGPGRHPHGHGRLALVGARRAGPAPGRGLLGPAHREHRGVRCAGPAGRGGATRSSGPGHPWAAGTCRCTYRPARC